jgi:hypothetical protein
LSTERPLERFESLKLGPWPAYTGIPIGGDQIPVGGSPVVRGRWGKKFRGSRRSQGWSVLGKRGAVAACRRRTRAGGGAPRGGDGVPMAGVPEGGGKVARKLPRGDMVLVVCLAGAKRRRGGGMAARPSDGGARAHRRCGRGCLGAGT